MDTEIPPHNLTRGWSTTYSCPMLHIYDSPNPVQMWISLSCLAAFFHPSQLLSRLMASFWTYMCFRFLETYFWSLPQKLARPQQFKTEGEWVSVPLMCDSRSIVVCLAFKYQPGPWLLIWVSGSLWLALSLRTSAPTQHSYPVVTSGVHSSPFICEWKLLLGANSLELPENGLKRAQDIEHELM